MTRDGTGLIILRQAEPPLASLLGATSSSEAPLLLAVIYTLIDLRRRSKRPGSDASPNELAHTLT